MKRRQGPGGHAAASTGERRTSRVLDQYQKGRDRICDWPARLRWLILSSDPTALAGLSFLDRQKTRQVNPSRPVHPISHGTQGSIIVIDTEASYDLQMPNARTHEDHPQPPSQDLGFVCFPFPLPIVVKQLASARSLARASACFGHWAFTAIKLGGTFRFCVQARGLPMANPRPVT